MQLSQRCCVIPGKVEWAERDLWGSPICLHQITPRSNGNQRARPPGIPFQGLDYKGFGMLFSSQIPKQFKGRNLGK